MISWEGVIWMGLYVGKELDLLEYKFKLDYLELNIFLPSSLKIKP
jgi:hypothetical protein